ncbi:hypothetical protein ASPZODRAFT_71752 [Penicilliopsis zonata CBS 506.65]|uniref:C2H2-type domain-containing protein n=1 Tax=Penicilliopsis zonata CBS 506.65 TaxID=1073090 RepID=A0A1L9SB11_9EURO|nr:hypothetical protein ASPZODRAFT_71752 [Penicilliopsis zonata CBS 506.65]OJJ44365.1 hypothetical protein ASPZODRAFT_71752 [Penicilliopsis zonata CBS 506.65]
MSPRVKTEPGRVTLSQATLQNMDQLSQPQHNPYMPVVSSLVSRAIQDDELSSQDNFSLCSSTQHGRGTSHEMKAWSLSDDIIDPSAVSTEPESPEVQMLSFSLSQQLLPSAGSQSDVIYHAVSDYAGLPDMNDQNDLDFQNYASMVDFNAYENDACAQNGSQNSVSDDALSVGHSSHTDDSHFVAASDAWPLTVDTGNYSGSPLEQLSNAFQTAPVSPPLTEASNDVSVTSSCPHSGYPSYMPHDGVMLRDVTTTPICGQGLNLGDPMFPLTPPLSEQDPNRTIRPTKQARRPALSGAASQSQSKSEQDIFLPAAEPLRQRSKEGAELRNPRDHPYYSLPTQSDGKYYCPFASGDKPCNHPPTTQKCAYHKYLDSHLKPYRCKVPVCMDAQLQFSSNACLFRHEREAHGFHGHGDNPHLCLFPGCERAVPGYGFPRRWNLYDHMRRVHDYASSERPSSREHSPSAGQAAKKRESTGRKRRVTGVTGAPQMKRSRSNQSQTSVSKVAHIPAHHGQRLQNAERSYYSCRSRLLEELASIQPQDSAMHEKVNASLQELITLGLNYRHIEASQAAAQLSN